MMLKQTIAIFSLYTAASKRVYLHLQENRTRGCSVPSKVQQLVITQKIADFLALMVCTTIMLDICCTFFILTRYRSVDIPQSFTSQ